MRPRGREDGDGGTYACARDSSIGVCRLRDGGTVEHHLCPFFSVSLMFSVQLLCPGEYVGLSGDPVAVANTVARVFVPAVLVVRARAKVDVGYGIAQRPRISSSSIKKQQKKAAKGVCVKARGAIVETVQKLQDHQTTSQSYKVGAQPHPMSSSSTRVSPIKSKLRARARWRALRCPPRGGCRDRHCETRKHGSQSMLFGRCHLWRGSA